MPKPHIEKCWKEKLQLKENSQAGDHSCKHETTGYFYLDVRTFSSGCVATRRRNTLWQQNTFILCVFLKTLLDQKHCVVTTYKWNLNLKKHKAATYLHILLIGLSSGPLSFNVIVIGQFSLITEGLTNTHTHPHTHYNDINSSEDLWVQSSLCITHYCTSHSRPQQQVMKWFFIQSGRL